ncbi:MAG: amino acid ABC transporter permease [Candidatus Bipolaricaulis sp.]|nr:amino acid ABC transporter permease [Candidatus Bipolaricaulis sp.]
MSYFEFVGMIMPRLLRATVVTLELTAIGIGSGFVLGLLLALTRVYAHRVVSGIANVYIQFFRATPLVIQALIIYFGLPPYLAAMGLKPLSPFAAGCVALGLNSAAYQAEYLRGAIQAISSGQMLAARSMGMTKAQAVRSVILPQALRIVLPSWSNELIYTLLYSSVVYFVTLDDLTFVSMKIAAKYGRAFDSYSAAALIYLAIVVLLSRVLAYVEARVRIPGLSVDDRAR